MPLIRRHAFFSGSRNTHPHTCSPPLPLICPWLVILLRCHWLPPLHLSVLSAFRQPVRAAPFPLRRLSLAGVRCECGYFLLRGSLDSAGCAARSLSLCPSLVLSRSLLLSSATPPQPADFSLSLSCSFLSLLLSSCHQLFSSTLSS